MEHSLTWQHSLYIKESQSLELSIQSFPKLTINLNFTCKQVERPFNNTMHSPELLVHDSGHNFFKINIDD